MVGIYGLVTTGWRHRLATETNRGRSLFRPSIPHCGAEVASSWEDSFPRDPLPRQPTQVGKERRWLKDSPNTACTSRLRRHSYRAGRTYSDEGEKGGRAWRRWRGTGMERAENTGLDLGIASDPRLARGPSRENSATRASKPATGPSSLRASRLTTHGCSSPRGYRRHCRDVLAPSTPPLRSGVRPFGP